MEEEHKITGQNKIYTLFMCTNIQSVNDQNIHYFKRKKDKKISKPHQVIPGITREYFYILVVL